MQVGVLLPGNLRHAVLHRPGLLHHRAVYHRCPGDIVIAVAGHPVDGRDIGHAGYVGDMGDVDVADIRTAHAVGRDHSDHGLLPARLTRAAFPGQSQLLLPTAWSLSGVPDPPDRPTDETH